MGYYVNPKNMPKEKWLNENSHPKVSNFAPKWNETPSGHLPVCLIDNGPFTAAAICYSPEELAEFARNDGRAKIWLFVETEKLKTVSDIPL